MVYNTGLRVPEGTAKLFVEMGTAIRSGKIWEDYDAHKVTPAGRTKLEAFAKEFAAKFKEVDSYHYSVTVFVIVLQRQ